MAEKNPLVWMAEVNGLLVDLRDMPREVQEIAFEDGLIPYIPADGKEQSSRPVSVLRNLAIDCRPPPSSLRSPGAADLSILSPLPRQQPQQTPPSLLSQARAVLYCAT